MPERYCLAPNSLTDSSIKLNDTVPTGSGHRLKDFPILLGCSTGTIAPLAELVDASGSNPDSLRSEGSNPSWGTCCSLLLKCTNRFLSHEGGENSINFPRKPCSGFSLLYPTAWVGISHAGQPWWGNSWTSFRSPNGRGMILNINQCRSESCRKHDVRQKVTRKRTNTHRYGGIADHARNKAKTRTSVRKTSMSFLEPYALPGLFP